MSNAGGKGRAAFRAAFTTQLLHVTTIDKDKDAVFQAQQNLNYKTHQQKQSADCAPLLFLARDGTTLEKDKDAVFQAQHKLNYETGQQKQGAECAPLLILTRDGTNLEKDEGAVFLAQRKLNYKTSHQKQGAECAPLLLLAKFSTTLEKDEDAVVQVQHKLNYETGQQNQGAECALLLLLARDRHDKHADFQTQYMQLISKDLLQLAVLQDSPSLATQNLTAKTNEDIPGDSQTVGAVLLLSILVLALCFQTQLIATDIMQAVLCALDVDVKATTTDLASFTLALLHYRAPSTFQTKLNATDIMQANLLALGTVLKATATVLASLTLTQLTGTLVGNQAMSVVLLLSLLALLHYRIP